uniref:Uncharacterized protein n=1 Tax=Zonotrichia albicollis TaxID=44394 RepID=A0A8D2MN94_ZONAL
MEGVGTRVTCSACLAYFGGVFIYLFIAPSRPPWQLFRAVMEKSRAVVVSGQRLPPQPLLQHPARVWEGWEGGLSTSLRAGTALGLGRGSTPAVIPELSYNQGWQGQPKLQEPPGPLQGPPGPLQGPSNHLVSFEAAAEEAKGSQVGGTHGLRGFLSISLFFMQLYELDGDPRRKEFLDDLFSFMQKRGECPAAHPRCAPLPTLCPPCSSTPTLHPPCPPPRPGAHFLAPH